MKLCVYIPAFQAESTLAAVVRRIYLVPLADVELHVLVIDDGSQDGTSELTHQLHLNFPSTELHTFAQNRGYGAAAAFGLKWARSLAAEAAVCIHADGQYPPEAIPRLLEMLGHGVDLVQGSRHLDGTALAGGMPKYKWIAGLALSTLERKVLGVHLTDLHSGLLAFGARALATLPETGMSSSFDFDLEAIARCRAAGLAIGEIGIPTRYADEVSHLRSFPYGVSCLRVLWRYRQGDFNPTGRSP